MKKKIISISQILLAVTILTLIFVKMDKKEELISAVKQAYINWPYVIAALGCTFTCICACTLRWQILLNTVDVKLSYMRVLTLYFIGQFFSALFPGMVGGDLPKAIYVAKESPHKRTEVVSTVFIDRIIGLLALVLLCSVLVLARLDFFLTNNYTKGAMLFVALLFAASSAGLFIVFYKNLFEHFAIFRKLEETTSLGKIIRKVYDSFRLCLKHKSTILKTGLISILNHTQMVMGVYFLSKALGTGLSLINCLTIFPIINAIAAIPISPGGLGTKELACIVLLGAMDVNEVDAVTLSLLSYLSFFIWSLPGFVVYVIYSIKEGKIDIKAELKKENA